MPHQYKRIICVTITTSVSNLFSTGAMKVRPKMLLQAVREAIRVKHDSLRTVKSYIKWIKRYIGFHDRRHPREMGGAEIETFLAHLDGDNCCKVFSNSF